MEISGIGGYRRDRSRRDRNGDDGGLGAARASVTGVLRASEDSALLNKPPPPRSLNSAPESTALGSGDHGDRLLAGGHRASEPILLDFDLPSPSRKQTQQSAAKRSSKASNSTSNSDEAAAAAGASPATRPKRKSMPRLENLLPPLRITEEQKAAYKQAAESRIADMLTRCQAAWDGTNGIFEDPKLWKLHSSKPNLSVYRRRSQSAVQYHPFVATGRVPGLTLQDLQYGLYAETTPDERAINAYWFGAYFLDAAILEAFETQTEDDGFRFFGIKWLLTGVLGGIQMIAPRDMAFMQYTKTIWNEMGEKILIKVVESVPENIVPLLPDQGDLRFVRSELSIIYMYHYDAKAKEVQVFCEGNIDPAGRSRSMMANVNLSLFAPAIVNFAHIADAKFITKHGLMFPHNNNSPMGKMSIALSVSTHIPSPMAASSRADSMASQLTASWVPDHQRKACFVCFKSFGLLRRHRHHCRMCGEVMCSQCMVTLPLVAPPEFDADENAHFPLQNQPAKKRLEDTNRHGFPVVNTFKFCKKCMFTVRQERRAMVAGVGNYYFTEGMLRNREQMVAAFAGKYVAPFAGDDGASGFPDDDETIIDDVQYSKRIEKLRQEHMEREKQKLREQHRNALAAQERASVRLFDESDFTSSESSSNRLSATSGSEVSFDFDNLVVTDSAALMNRSESDRFSAKLPAAHIIAAYTAAAGMAEALPPSVLQNYRDSASSNNNQSEHSGNGSTTVNSSLLQIDTDRERSYSIPEQFEIMERSIAEQEALLSSIQLERAKAMTQQGGAAPRLPIDAVMRSMALSSKHQVTAGSNQIDNDSGANAGQQHP